MGASALQHGSSPACEWPSHSVEPSRVKSQVKSSQVKQVKFKSILYRCGALGFPLPSFPVLTPWVIQKSPPHVTSHIDLLCNGTGSKTPGGAGTPRDRHKNLTNQPQTITVPVRI